MTEQILGALKNGVAAVEIVPGSGGIFEVARDGQTIFSKRQAGRFPEWDEIRAALS